MFRLRRRQKSVLPLSNRHAEKKLKRKPRCLRCINVVLGALIPLMIGIATIVMAVVDEKLEDKRRQQDQELAYLTRLQDSQLADDLYYQSVYKTYVEDVSNVLFKSNNSFIDNEKKMKYIRTKTLTALDQLDWQHKSRLFLFLYETGLLSSNTTNVSLDLSGANFVNISIQSTLYKKLSFNNLHLPSVDLTNASFINCQFNEGVDFSDSLMVGAKFTRSTFKCSKTYTGSSDSLGNIHVKFHRSNLERSDFSDSYLCDTSFARTNLAYSTINRITFQGLIEFRGTNLTAVNWDQSFTTVSPTPPASLNFFNIDFRTIPLNMESLEITVREYVKMNNVILRNGTWIFNESNLIVNGNAEINCHLGLEKHVPTSWVFSSVRNYSFPTISDYSQMENTSFGNCSFNFTVIDKPVAMEQNIDVDDYAAFIDTDEAEYKFSSNIHCVKGEFVVVIAFYDMTSAWLDTSQPYLPIDDTLIWHTRITSAKILAKTRGVKILVVGTGEKDCLIDNIEFHIRKKNIQ